MFGRRKHKLTAAQLVDIDLFLMVNFEDPDGEEEQLIEELFDDVPQWEDDEELDAGITGGFAPVTSCDAPPFEQPMYSMPAAAPAPSAAPRASRPKMPSFGSARSSAPAPRGLDGFLASMDESFSVSLMRLIDASGKRDAEVYKDAGLTRQHFSKIRSDEGYRPTKKTALALCLALELNLAATNDLLARAGYTLSRANKADVIVEYFITEGIHDLDTIDEALYHYDQPLLRS